MKTIADLFGVSPFKLIVNHARKIHECVNLVRPIADAIIKGDMDALRDLHKKMSDTEYQADMIKDEIREKMPRRIMLPVNRDDLFNLVRQLDRMADDAEDFAVVATFRKLDMPESIRTKFLALADKVIQTSEALLNIAEDMAELQREAFQGDKAHEVLNKIHYACRLEWESDKLSRDLARAYYSIEGMDPVTIMILDKLSNALAWIADSAENVGKNLRLMIVRY